MKTNILLTATARSVCVGLVVLLICAPSGCMSVKSSSTRVTYDADGAVLEVDNHVLARYRHESVPYKPYVSELYSPAGVNVVRDNVPDHLHHHGLMYAVAVDGVNFWEEQKQPGLQKNQGVNDVVRIVDNPLAAVRQRLNWMKSPDDEVLLEEDREVSVQLMEPRGAALLTWKTKLAVPPGKETATLSGSHYFGLGMRFVESMDAVGAFSNADNKPGRIFRGHERLVESDWCAYAAEADGKPVTVAMFGDPANTRHPTTWFTMAKPFAYLSATLNLHEEPLQIASGRPLNLRYGVAVWDGHVGNQAIESLYQTWLKKASK